MYPTKGVPNIIDNKLGCGSPHNPVICLTISITSTILKVLDNIIHFFVSMYVLDNMHHQLFFYENIPICKKFLYLKMAHLYRTLRQCKTHLLFD